MPIKNVNGFSMHYEDVGSGDPIIFQHGWVSSGNIWTELLPRLKDHYRCIALDARGTGESGRPADGYTVKDYAADLLGLADALGIEQFAIVGHSLGGTIATQAALMAPDRITRMVLLGSPVDIAHVPPAVGESLGAVAEQLISGNREVAAGFFASVTARREDAPFDRLIDTALACSGGFIGGSLQSLGEFSPGSVLNSLQTPTLMVGGSADPFLGPSLAGAQALGNCALHVFNRVSHGMQWEVPDELASVIDDFMRHGVVTAASLAEG